MKIRIPASSANLGPGFDSFGIAWQLYNEIEFEALPQGLRIEGCEERFQNENNLALRAFSHTLKKFGVKQKGTLIRFVNSDIPVSRGLGSSAALIAAGVKAADALYGLGLGPGVLLNLATEVEGHPDNVAPALFGGMTVSLLEGKRALTRRFNVHEKLRFTLLIPPFELSTALSRSVMPKEVSMHDAVFNLSRAALLPHALETGDHELLRVCLQDRLHQPYRRSLIDGMEQAERLSEEAGCIGLCLSGAGSTLLCIGNVSEQSALLAEKAKKCLPGWIVREAVPDLTGAVIVGSF